ncbi:hypothetical protein MMC18_008547 [Xylographa bjoerkii]|nr:hypothetical protein [Xylographa bjoerkii]
MATYEVDSYFIDVSDGDCAVHVLVQVQGNQRTFQKAILVDGGRLERQQRVKSAFDSIRQEYYLPELRFNAIVVTHWDDDHFQATQKMIRDDLIAQYNPTNAVQTYESKYMVYHNHVPQTAFYCADTKSTRSFPNPSDYQGDIHYLFVDEPVANSNPPTIQLALHMRLEDQGFGLGHAQVKILCKRVVKGVDCIGYNIFENDFAKNPQNNNQKLALNQMVNLDVMLNNLPFQGAPALCCVGADVIVADSPVPNRELRTNESSLMCLLVWPKVIPNNQNERWVISMYTGGDAEKDEESSMLHWLLKKNAANQICHDGRIRCIKAGHHGSKNATHGNFFFFTPEVIVFCAGKKHGHPSFALIVLLMIMIEFGFRQTNLKLMYPLQYPYWINSGLLNSLMHKSSTVNMNLGDLFEEGSDFPQEIIRVAQIVAHMLRPDEAFPNVRLGPSLIDAKNYYKEHGVLTTTQIQDMSAGGDGKSAGALADYYLALARYKAIEFIDSRWARNGLPETMQDHHLLKVHMTSNGDINAVHYPPPVNTAQVTLSQLNLSDVYQEVVNNMGQEMELGKTRSRSRLIAPMDKLFKSRQEGEKKQVTKKQRKEAATKKKLARLQGQQTLVLQ